MQSWEYLYLAYSSYLTGVQSFADDEADSTSKASADSQTQTVNLMTHETTQFYVNYFGAYVGTASANLLVRCFILTVERSFCSERAQF